MPLNVIESNTELISFYRRKRSIEEVLKSGVKGITSNSVDSLESLSEAAILALHSMSTDLQSLQIDPKQNKLTTPKADSYFSELLEQNMKKDKIHSRKKRYAYEPTDRISEIFSQYERLASDSGRRNCSAFTESERTLPGDVIYGVPTQFESQAKLALSISHFLSSFYQIINTEEDFPLRNAEKPISEDQLYAEVISAIAADFRVS